MAKAEKKLTRVMAKLMDAKDVQLEVMQKTVDEAILLAIDEMKNLITNEDSKPEIKVQAANNVVSTGNYLTKRRALVSGKNVTVFIGKDMQINGSAVDEEGRAMIAEATDE